MHGILHNNNKFFINKVLINAIRHIRITFQLENDRIKRPRDPSSSTSNDEKYVLYLILVNKFAN